MSAAAHTLAVAVAEQEREVRVDAVDERVHLRRAVADHRQGLGGEDLLAHVGRTGDPEALHGAARAGAFVGGEEVLFEFVRRERRRGGSGEDGRAAHDGAERDETRDVWARLEVRCSVADEGDAAEILACGECSEQRRLAAGARERMGALEVAVGAVRVEDDVDGVYVAIRDAECARDLAHGRQQATRDDEHAFAAADEARDEFSHARHDGLDVTPSDALQRGARRTHAFEPQPVHVFEREFAVHRALGERSEFAAQVTGEFVDAFDRAERRVAVEDDRVVGRSRVLHDWTQLTQRIGSMRRSSSSTCLPTTLSMDR
jgi:hypothetical protein